MELKLIEEGLLKLLAENHYSEGTIKTYKQFWRRLEDFLLEKFGSTEFSMARGMLYLNERCSFLKNYQRETLPQQRVQYLRMVHLLEDYQLHGVLTRRYYAAKNPIVLDGEYLSIHEGFKAYLQTTQCSKNTANHYTRISCVLLDYLRQKSLEVGSIDLAACNGFLSTFSGYSYKAIEQTTCGLRYFLRYLNETSILANSISDKIHMAKMSKQAKIPCVWKAADLKCLLQTVPRNSPIGKKGLCHDPHGMHPRAPIHRFETPDIGRFRLEAEAPDIQAAQDRKVHHTPHPQSCRMGHHRLYSKRQASGLRNEDSLRKTHATFRPDRR